eukprot:g29328.t1
MHSLILTKLVRPSKFCQHCNKSLDSGNWCSFMVCSCSPLRDCLEGLWDSCRGIASFYLPTPITNEIDCLAAWCKDNTVSINISKMKELVIDFRKQSGGHAPVCVNGADLEMVQTDEFLG